MGFFRALAVVFIVAPLVLQSGAAEAGSVKIHRKIKGSFLTNVAGSSVSQPPYIQVIRSRDGLDYTLSRFGKLKNKITQRRIDYLQRQLAGLDFDKVMIIGIFSQPMDNFNISVGDVTVDDGRGAMEVEVSYTHKIKNLRIPPKKSIHYTLLITPKSDLPVTLKAIERVRSKKRKDAKLITVTGRVMKYGGGEELQLVPVVIKRGNKNSYFLKGGMADSLFEHTGKVVTLRGTLSRERNSPYEFDLTVKKIVKVFR